MEYLITDVNSTGEPVTGSRHHVILFSVSPQGNGHRSITPLLLQQGPAPRAHLAAWAVSDFGLTMTRTCGGVAKQES